MAPDPPSSQALGELLQKRSASSSPPTDAELLPAYNYLLPHFPATQPIAGSSKLPSTGLQQHLYCAECTEELVRDAATYLIFLFAFKRDGMSGRWLEALEKVLQGCDKCARGFAAARRRFKSR